MKNFLFKDRDGQTPLPKELQKGLRIKTIQTIGELDEYEEDNIIKGLNWLATQKANPCKYDFWIKTHKKLFENVWSWAGKIRDYELANPDFALPHKIWPEIYRLEKDLHTWSEFSLTGEQKVAPCFHERIETIHPFANGNGRFGRIITEQICKYLKLKIPTWGRKFYDRPSERRQRYIEALVIARRERSFSKLEIFMFS